MDEYAAARRTAIVRCFIDALTRGGIPDALRATVYIFETAVCSNGRFVR